MVPMVVLIMILAAMPEPETLHAHTLLMLSDKPSVPKRPTTLIGATTSCATGALLYRAHRGHHAGQVGATGQHSLQYRTGRERLRVCSVEKGFWRMA